MGLCGLRIGQTLDPRPRYMCPAVLEPVVGFVVGRWASSRGVNEMVLWEALGMQSPTSNGNSHRCRSLTHTHTPHIHHTGAHTRSKQGAAGALGGAASSCPSGWSWSLASTAYPASRETLPPCTPLSVRHPPTIPRRPPERSMSEDVRRDSNSTAMAEREKVIRDLIIQNPVPLDKLRALVSHESKSICILLDSTPRTHLLLCAPPPTQTHDF